MTTLRAREQLELISTIATAFGSLPADARSSLIDGLREAADYDKTQRGKDLSKLDSNQVQAIFARFGIPVITE